MRRPWVPYVFSCSTFLSACGFPEPPFSQGGPGGACQWQKRFGDAYRQEAYGLSVAGDGSLFLTGHSFGALNFGDGLGWQTGSGYVAKLDEDGKGLWSRVFGPGDVLGHAVTAYPDGGAVVVGAMSGAPVDFGGGPLEPGGELAGFAARFDAAGNHVWSRLGNSQGWTELLAVAAGGPDGRIAVSVGCGGATELAGSVEDCGGGQMFIAMLSPESGAASWVTPALFESPNDRVVYVRSLAVDSAGDVVAAGEMLGVVDFGVGSAGGHGSRTGVVFKVNGDDGAVRWVRPLGPRPDGTHGTVVALDPDGNPVVATALSGAHDFGDGCVVSDLEPPDVVVVKLEAASGDCSWIRHFPAVGHQWPMAVATGGDGSVAVGGVLAAPIDFGFGEHALHGEVDAFLLRLAPNGQPVWSRSFGDANDGHYPEWLWGLGVDAAGHVCTAGGFDGEVDFCDDGASLRDAGQTDIFVARYAQ